jgi:hypothetical protein
VARGGFQVYGLVALKLSGDGWEDTPPKWLALVHALKIKALYA